MFSIDLPFNSFDIPQEEYVHSTLSLYRKPPFLAQKLYNFFIIKFTYF